MQYVLFVMLALLLLVSFLVSNKDILAPSVIANAMFLFCCFFTVLNTEKWGIIDFHIETVVFILASLFTFTIGCIIGDWGIRSDCRNYSFCDIKTRFSLTNGKLIKISKLGWSIIALFLAISLAIYTKETYLLSIKGGNTKGLSYMIYYARRAQLNLNTNVSSLAQHLFLMCKSTSYVLIFCFFYNVFLERFRLKYLIFWFPTVIYSGMIILSSGRLLFINLFVFIFIVGILVYKKTNKKFNLGTGKILKKGVALLVLFFTLFFLYGFFVRKDTMGIFDTISIYAGSGIYALDRFLSAPIKRGDFFGSETLISIYLILEKLGFETPSLYSPREFVSFSNDYQTNIFTALRRYFVDYRVIGTLIFLLILGIVYGILYNRIRNNPYVGLKIILAGILYEPIVEFAIEERFLLKVCSLSMLYEFIYISFLFFLVFKRIKCR